MRVWLFAFGLLEACALIACVGDSSPPSDASTDQTTTEASTDAGAADAEAGVSCAAKAPQLFNPVLDAGPFCNGAGPGNHCPWGEHCCTNANTNAHVCAASCDAGTVDIACFSNAECASGLQCCGNGNVDTTSCKYPVVGSFTGTLCAASCSSSEFVECWSNVECGAKVCTPAYALDPTNASTGVMQLATCL